MGGVGEGDCLKTSALCRMDIAPRFPELGVTNEKAKQNHGFLYVRFPLRFA